MNGLLSICRITARSRLKNKMYTLTNIRCKNAFIGRLKVAFGQNANGKILFLHWKPIEENKGMGILYLSVELAFDMLTCIIGCILIFQAKDNYQKRYWGMIAACIGAVFIWENVGWLMIVSETPSYRFTDLLSIEKMLKWYIPASIVCLFPTASLCPGYLTPFRILVLQLFPLVTITIGLSYLGFNGYITPIMSLAQIFPNLGKTDVLLRSVIFLITVITPTAFALYPVIHHKAYRKISKEMYLFIGFMFLFLIIYILFTLSINEFIFNLFGITAVAFTLLFSFEYLFNENPFSTHTQMLYNGNLQDESLSGKQSDVQILPLFSIIEDTLKENLAFTNQNYSIKDLAEVLSQKESAVSEAIKSSGYTGFREYICSLRLEYFKELADTCPEKNVKELMFQCGFTSRSTFYRNFMKKYGVSPLKYLEGNESISL